MLIWSEKDLFCPKEENEKLLDPKIPYLSAIGVLIYFTNCFRPNIAFYVNLLTRYNSALTKRHWNGFKHNIIQKNQNHNLLGMQMQDIFQSS